MQTTTNTSTLPDTQDARKTVDWFEAENFATMVSIEVEKARYLLQNVIDDFLEPLRYDVMHENFTNARYRAFIEIHNAEVMARIMEDILSRLDANTDEFSAKIAGK